MNPHDNHIRFTARQINDPRVVIVSGNLAGLVRHARCGGQSGGDAVVETLRRQNLDHLLAGAFIQEFVQGARCEKQSH